MAHSAARTRRLERHSATAVERFESQWSGGPTPTHAHEEFQITLTVGGCGRYSYLGHQARLPVGCLAVFHPGEPHVIGCESVLGPWSLRSLHVPASWLEEHGLPLLQPAPVIADGALREAFDGCWAAFDAAGEPGSASSATTTSALSAGLHALAVALVRRPGIEPRMRPTSQLVRRCLAHLRAASDQPLDLRDMAEATGASPAQIRRVMVAATGLSPQAWHLQQRIQRAKQQLAAGTSIASTALATGFADQAHFTRHFTRLVGVSPARYVAGMRAATNLV